MKPPIQSSNSVIVFDLDDTLYPEFAYKVSGINAVLSQINQLYPHHHVADLIKLIDWQSDDWLDVVCCHCQLNDNEKNHCYGITAYTIRIFNLIYQ